MPNTLSVITHVLDARSILARAHEQRERLDHGTVADNTDVIHALLDVIDDHLEAPILNVREAHPSELLDRRLHLPRHRARPTD